MSEQRIANVVAAFMLVILAACGGGGSSSTGSTSSTGSGSSGSTPSGASAPSGASTPASTSTAAWSGIQQDSAPYDYLAAAEDSPPLNTASSSGFALTTDQQGNVIIGGSTDGTFTKLTLGEQEPQMLPGDAFVAKYNSAGVLQWGTQLLDAHSDAGGWGLGLPGGVNDIPSGNAGFDAVSGIAADSTGNIFAVGTTLAGGVSGESFAESAFIAKLGPNGNRLWIHGLGATTGSLITGGNAIAVDSSGNAYIVGQTSASLPGQTFLGTGNITNYFIAKYDSSGNRQWLLQRVFNDPSHVGPASSVAIGVAVDSSGSVYLTGGTDYHPFVDKFNGSGALQWETYMPAVIQNVGAGFTNTWSAGVPTSIAVSTDGSKVFIAGGTIVELAEAGTPHTPSGSSDAFVTLFNGSGVQQWSQTLEASTTTACGPTSIPVCGFGTQAYSIAAKPDGSAVFITGFTFGALPGQTATNPQANNGTSSNIIAAGIDSSGKVLWTKQMGAGPFNGSVGAPGKDVGYGVGMDASGDVFVTGVTEGHLGVWGAGANGGDNWFVMKMNPATGSVY